LGLFNALAEHQERAGFDEAVPLEVVRGFLEDRLEAERIGYGFLSGGVTFCAMLPMRSIPFHTVCLVGMNHDAFPREHHPPAFDLMSRQPRRGDRSRRNDDKYLFLEALLSARRRFYVSYIGQGIQDNRPQPPSVLVGELLDALERNYGGSGGPSGGGWTTRHRLQAFSEAYFDGSCGLFSYSREDLDGCRAGREASPGGAFFSGPIEMPAEEAPGWREVSPERLRAFFAHPVRFLVQGRLDLRLEEAPGSPDAREPFALDPLSRYRLAQAFLGALRDGENPRSLLPFFRAAGELPHGAAGDLVFDRLRQEVELFFKGIEGFLPSAHGAEISVGARLGDFRLNAVLRHLSVEGDLSVRYAAAAAKDFLGAWIRHLFLCIGAEGRLPCRSLMVAKGSAWSFAPVADGRRVLGELLALYARGLTEPLPFFPETSLEYFRRQSRPAADPEAALALARRKWEGSEEAPGDSADPYHRLCFGEADPLGDEFKRISVAVFGPLFDHCRQLTPAG
jgi:exodeoxyribonuclease V gamma subunit